MTDQAPKSIQTKVADKLQNQLGASGVTIGRAFAERLARDALAIAYDGFVMIPKGGPDTRWSESAPTPTPPGLHGEGWQTKADELMHDATPDPKYAVAPQLPLPGWQERLAEAVREVHDATSVTDIFEHPAAGPVYASGGYISQSQVYEDAMNGPNVPDPPLKPGEVRNWKNLNNMQLQETLETFPVEEVVGVGVRGKSDYCWWLVLRGRGDT